MPFTQDFQPLRLRGPALLGAPGIASPLSGHAIRASGVAAALDISAQSLDGSLRCGPVFHHLSKPQFRFFYLVPVGYSAVRAFLLKVLVCPPVRAPDRNCFCVEHPFL